LKFRVVATLHVTGDEARCPEGGLSFLLYTHDDQE
jgi:hypothetical protein